MAKPATNALPRRKKLRPVARIVVVFEDAVGAGGLEQGMNIHIESAEPPMPLKGNQVDVDRTTPAQAAVWFALNQLMDEAGFAELFTAEEGPKL